MVINASWGLGEAIVSGQVTPDTLVVRKADGAVVSRQIAAKERMIVPCPAGGTQTVAIPSAAQPAEALADPQIAGLVTLGRQVESHYRTPQDIEWAYARGAFYLLQARPITTLAAEQATGEFSRTMFVEIFPHALSPSFASVVKPIFTAMLGFLNYDFLMIALIGVTYPVLAMRDIVQASRAAYAADQARNWPEIIRNGQEIWLDASPAGAGQEPEVGLWQGVGGSPHVVTGVARIIHGPEEFHCLAKGEILVAPSTDPAWTSLFAVASGLVTEVGGILSHGAIVAREYGIPAVMGVRGITAALSTGQLVQVDGNRGRVRVVA